MERFLFKQASSYVYCSLPGPEVIDLESHSEKFEFTSYSCKQSPWEQTLLLCCAFFRKTLPCLIQELEGPVPGQGWQQGWWLSASPRDWCGERRLSLHPSAWYKTLWWWPLSALASWGQCWACCKSCSVLGPRAVPGWGHVAHNCLEGKSDPASPALYFSRESTEREEIGRCYTRTCWMNSWDLTWFIWEPDEVSVTSLCFSGPMLAFFLQHNSSITWENRGHLFPHLYVIRFCSVTNTGFLTSRNWCHS